MSGERTDETTVTQAGRLVLEAPAPATPPSTAGRDPLLGSVPHAAAAHAPVVGERYPAERPAPGTGYRAGCWVEGEMRFSPMYRGEFRCLRRFFVGMCEMVELQQVTANAMRPGEGVPVIARSFVRTARAMSDPVFPGVVARGGAFAPGWCSTQPDHGKEAVEEDGRVYCCACGGEVTR